MLTASLYSLQKNKKNQIALLYLGIFYFILYFIYLVKCQYIPYVFDNNETFSALTHARNMAMFGFKTTFGLTDETFSILPSAHPFVYTHQGNFPRFYTYILYIMGFETFGCQVFITTFTIGFAGLIFCHQFISKNISTLFSIIFCTLLMTDYIMFSQWQVNVWRVWQFFFFFSSFICSQKILENKNSFFIPLSILNFCCLAYTEISFTIFVTLSCLIYSFLQTDNKKRIFLNTFIIGTGIGLGLFILIYQNIMFLGWENFITDLKYTFSSRNSLDHNEKTKILEFFQIHKIAFWESFNSINNLRNPFKILALFYQYCLLPYTPFLNFLVFSSFILTFMKYKKIVLPDKLVHLMSVIFLICVLVINEKYIFKSITQIKIEWLLLLIATIYISHKLLNSKKILNLISLLIFLSSIYIIINFLNNQNITFSNHLIYLSLQQFQIRELYFITFAIFFIYLCENIQIPNQLLLIKFKPTLYLFCSCFLGFILSFLILPGYILAGYLYRYCCFTVYAHMLLYAWFIYAIVLNLLSTNFNIKERLYIINKIIIPCYLLIIFIVSWYNLQIAYMHEFKPDNFKFIRKLEKDYILKNKTIVANQYSAPFTYISKTWGYYDPEIINSTLSSINQKDHLKITKDFKYLWFNDAKTNKSYQSPDIFICWIPYNIEQFNESKPRCGDYNLVKLARSHKSKQYNLIEYARDDSGEDKWSIILLKSFYIDEEYVKSLIKKRLNEPYHLA